MWSIRCPLCTFPASKRCLVRSQTATSFANFRRKLLQLHKPRCVDKRTWEEDFVSFGCELWANGWIEETCHWTHWVQEGFTLTQPQYFHLIADSCYWLSCKREFDLWPFLSYKESLIVSIRLEHYLGVGVGDMAKNVCANFHFIWNIWFYQIPPGLDQNQIRV